MRTGIYAVCVALLFAEIWFVLCTDEKVLKKERGNMFFGGYIVCALADTLDKLIPTFVEAFNGAPWFETWSQESAGNYLRKYAGIRKSVLVFIESERKNVAFGFGLPLSQHEASTQLVNLGADPNAFYIADVATGAEYRKQGFGMRVVSALVGKIYSDYPEIIVRTKDDNIAMIKLVESLGFTKLASYSAETGGVASVRVVFRLDCKAVDNPYVDALHFF